MDMHGNSLKTLRQDLLKRRKEFAAGQSHALSTNQLIANLYQFLTGSGSSIQSIALYWPIQDEIDLRTSLLDWVKAKPHRE